MKYLSFLLLFTYTTISFSQIESRSFSDKYEEFDYYAKPSKTNILSKYFKNHIDSDLLKAYKIDDTLENKKRIFLTFHFNKANKVSSIYVKTPYFELNKSITEAFKEFDIEKLNIPVKSPLNIYTLQILSVEDDKMVINCSSDIIYDRFPVYEGCETMTNNYQMKSCINKLLEAHIAKNISPTVIKKSMVLGALNLKPKFIINEIGVVELIQTKAAVDSLSKELNRVVTLFPKAKTPPMRNGKPTRIIFTGNVRLEIATENKEYIAEVIKSKDSTLNPNSELALHFKKFISQDELTKNIFPLSKKRVEISFSIDKNGKKTGVKANSSSPKFNNRLVEIFKNFQTEKLNIDHPNVLETYQFTILTKEYPVSIIQCNDKPNVFKAAIYNKNCEKSDSKEDLSECLWENINKIVKRNFDTKLLLKTNLNGEFKVYCSFQVDTEAKITNIKIQAPNPIIANEVEEIIKEIPNLYKPAYWNEKAIISTFRVTIPIRLKEGNFEDSFKKFE